LTQGINRVAGFKRQVQTRPVILKQELRHVRRARLPRRGARRR